MPIPLPVRLGSPGEHYPWPWSIYGWLDDEPAQFARFLVALRSIDASGGPEAGEHNFHRGGSLAISDSEAPRAIETLADEIDVRSVTDVWETALQTSWRGRRSGCMAMSLPAICW